MAKPDLGTKRICPETGRKFYDLGKEPIVSPYTGTSYPLSFFETAVTSSRGKSAPRHQEEEVEVETEAVETVDEAAETVSLSDVEEEDDTTGKSDVDVDDDEVEVEAGDDDTFIEADEDEEDDMTDIIGSREDDDD